ncbi:MAG TPA: SDR family oxidoreductase [Amycolatopsis sp.]|uniref:SDR family oxidoreductase n=1 Tax=Amycolatopsis nalaikhensis TaxID=715472 RepID=A0ABY8XKG7_9PSEU|nr:SDR family oxidoreductase [Amycolatopsis sp. 2-2]WIV56121.1 SDR family oxidoreductase [Amycolatopsis sp. 2-2]
MKIAGARILITGANRGLGNALARAALARGAAKVYAGARNPASVDLAGVTPIGLDITDPASVAAAASAATDVDVLINNAGVSTYTDLVTGDLDTIRFEMETQFFGTLNMVRAFAPVLKANGGGAIVNVLSALSWFSIEGSNAYAASKAAAWSLTNGVRLELAKQGTTVTGVHLGVVDTDMTKDYDGPKLPPSTVADAALDGLEAGELEVLADQWSADVKAALARDPREFYGARIA